MATPKNPASSPPSFRGVWVATIGNAQFPRTTGKAQFTSEYKKVLATSRSYDLDAVIFHVRPDGDAWYPSALNPWSKYITQARVEGTDPGFDPLQVMVDLTHEVGMEYHAWFNPYRASSYSPNTSAGLDSWRRDNVTQLIRDVQTAITKNNKEQGKSVKWGVSPSGIWQSNADHVDGSKNPSQSLSSYRDLYTDTRLWVKKEYVDYLVPQLYCSFSDTSSPYGELARWWNSVAAGTTVQIYIGLGLYLVGEADGGEPFANPKEIPNQLRFNEILGNVAGFALYSYNQLLPAPSNTTLTATQETLRKFWTPSSQAKCQP